MSSTGDIFSLADPKIARKRHEGSEYAPRLKGPDHRQGNYADASRHRNQAQVVNYLLARKIVGTKAAVVADAAAFKFGDIARAYIIRAAPCSHGPGIANLVFARERLLGSQQPPLTAIDGGFIFDGHGAHRGIARAGRDIVCRRLSKFLAFYPRRVVCARYKLLLPMKACSLRLCNGVFMDMKADSNVDHLAHLSYGTLFFEGKVFFDTAEAETDIIEQNRLYRHAMRSYIEALRALRRDTQAEVDLARKRFQSVLSTSIESMRKSNEAVMFRMTRDDEDAV